MCSRGCVCLRAYVRACVRACERASERVCVCVCARARARVRVCVRACRQKTRSLQRDASHFKGRLQLQTAIASCTLASVYTASLRMRTETQTWCTVCELARHQGPQGKQQAAGAPHLGSIRRVPRRWACRRISVCVPVCARMRYLRV